MYAWEAIEKTVDRIERDLDSVHDINTLAAEAALSPFYYQRLFRRLVGVPVAEYIRLRRLARAAGWLAEGGKVVDAAMASGFGSHEGFTRAFKAAYGLTPEQYKKAPVRLNHFERPALALPYTLVDEGVPLVAGGIVLEIARRALAEDLFFLGLERHVSIENNTPAGKSTGVDGPGRVWDEFHAAKVGLKSLVPGGEEWGFSYFGGAPEGCFTYMAGAEAPPGTAAENGQASRRIKAGEYIAVAIEAESQAALLTPALNTAMGYLFETWLPKRGLSSEPWSAERYLPPEGGVYHMELWVKPLPAKG